MGARTGRGGWVAHAVVVSGGKWWRRGRNGGRTSGGISGALLPGVSGEPGEACRHCRSSPLRGPRWDCLSTRRLVAELAGDPRPGSPTVNKTNAELPRPTGKSVDEVCTRPRSPAQAAPRLCTNLCTTRCRCLRGRGVGACDQSRRIAETITSARRPRRRRRGRRPPRSPSRGGPRGRRGSGGPARAGYGVSSGAPTGSPVAGSTWSSDGPRASPAVPSVSCSA